MLKNIGKIAIGYFVTKTLVNSFVTYMATQSDDQQVLDALYNLQGERQALTQAAHNLKQARINLNYELSRSLN